MAASHFLSEWMALPMESFTSDGHIIAGYAINIKNKCSQTFRKTLTLKFCYCVYPESVFTYVIHTQRQTSKARSAVLDHMRL